MSLRISTTCMIGVAVALTVGAASTAAAQADTTRRDSTARGARSTQRVPVSKDAPLPSTSSQRVPVSKEPVATRPDTTTRVSTGEVTVRDTVVVTRVETTTVVTPPPAPDTVFRTSTTDMRTTRSLFGNSGFYVGIGAGASVPYNQFSSLGYRTGVNVTVPIGYQPVRSPLGLRLTLSYDQAHAEETRNPNALPAFRGSAPDPKVYSATLDAVLKFPFRNSFGEERFAVYVNGGGGAHLFRGFGGTTALADVLGDDVGEDDDEPVEKNVTKWGVNVGGGVSYSLGSVGLFLESRWVNVFTSDSATGNDYLRWIPIVAGVTFR